MKLKGMLQDNRVICYVISFNRHEHLRGSSALKQGLLGMLECLGGSSMAPAMQAHGSLTSSRSMALLHQGDTSLTQLARSP